MNSPSSSELTSDLSSVGSLSPPPEYPTPPSSQDIISGVSQRLSQKRPYDSDNTPPAKKRKTAEPKPRSTRYLNLGAHPSSLATDQKIQFDTLLKVLRKRQKIVVVAGAGISVSAGIPDFRSDTGLFKSLREEHKLKASGKQLFDASVYQTDASTSSFHDMVRSLSEQASAAEPTEFHHMLAKLASDGRLMRLYTQNVDEIDTTMPPLETKVPLSTKGPWPRTVQLHGGLKKMVCLKCHNIFEFQPALFNGAEAPPCNSCIEADKIRTDHAGKRSHGIGRLRPRIVLYNEHNPDQDAIGAVMSADLKTRPDAVIVVGTSMKIPGVKRFVRELCGVVRDRRDGMAVWINPDPPPTGKEFDNCWDLIVEGDCDQVASHAKMRRWDDTSVDYQECTESEVEKAREKNSEVKVIIESAAKKAVQSALLTPAPSPRSKSVELEQFRKKISLKLTSPKPPKDSSQIPTSTEHSTTTGQAGFKAMTNLTNLLEKTKNKATKSKPQAKAKKPPKASLPNIKINQTFKISKPQVPKPRKPKSAHLNEDDNELSPRAMAPIPPSAARNNGPIQPDTIPTIIKPIFPNLASLPAQPSIENIHLPTITANPASEPPPPRQQYPIVKIGLQEDYFELGRGTRMGTPLVLASEIDDGKREKAVGRLKRLSEEIVSPTSIPLGMRALLH